MNASLDMNGEGNSSIDDEIKISNLSCNSETLFGLKNNELLIIAEELLAVFISKSHEWSNAANWSYAEMKLCGKKGFERGASAVRLRTALAVGNSIRCFVEYFQYVSDLDKGKVRRKKPSLLRRTRQVGKSKVYGPVSAGILGGEFEMWTREDEIETPELSAGVTLVLGAGNQSMVTALDTLSAIFIQRKTVLIKHHPLRPWLLEPYSILFEPLIRRGFIAQTLDEGISASTKLLSNRYINHVHITGSLESFNAIKKTLQLSRPEKSRMEIDEMITGELGNVSPWIINPDIYTVRELGHIACSMISSKKNYGGANCVAGQVIILPKHWDQKEEFRKAIEKEFLRQPDSAAYYPGSHKRKMEIISSYDPSKVKIMKGLAIQGDQQTQTLTEDDYVALIECGTPGTNEYNDKALKTEAFGPVLAIVELDYDKDHESDYLLEIAVPFVNNKSNIFGCLSCNLVSPPNTLKSQKILKAIENLKYGMIGVNEWIALAILPAVLGGIWGPYGLDETGHSGRGFVGNQYHIKGVEKMVVTRNLNLPPAFDEVAQPPHVLINEIGFLWATRPSNIIVLLFRGVYIVLSFMFGKFLNLISVASRHNAIGVKSHTHCD